MLETFEKQLAQVNNHDKTQVEDKLKFPSYPSKTILALAKFKESYSIVKKENLRNI